MQGNDEGPSKLIELIDAHQLIKNSINNERNGWPAGCKINCKFK